MFAVNASLNLSIVKSDWLKIQDEYSAHAQKIGSGQRSRSLVLTKRIVGSGDKDGYVSGTDWPLISDILLLRPIIWRLHRTQEKS